MAVSRVGSVFTRQASADGGLAVTVPADADIAIVVITGYNGTSAIQQLPGDLSWDNGGTVDFTQIGEAHYLGGETQVDTYYMTSDHPDWPGSGSQNLRVESANAYNEGFNVALAFYKGVDKTDPLLDVEEHHFDNSTSFTSALDGVGPDDMGLLAAYRFGESYADADLNSDDQTIVANLELFNRCAGALVEELGEDALTVTVNSPADTLNAVAFALRAAEDTSVILAISDSSHALAVDGVSLSQSHALSIDGSAHAQIAEAVGVVQAISLSVASASHSQLAENPAIVQSSVLDVSAVVHVLASDQAALSEKGTLAVSETAHGHVAGGATLVQAHVIDVTGSAHGVVSTQIALSEALLLGVADAMHATFGDSVEITLSKILGVAAAVHLHASDSLALTQAHALIVSDALHAQIAQQIKLLKPGDLSGAELFIVKAEDRFYVVAPSERYMVH